MDKLMCFKIQKELILLFSDKGYLYIYIYIYSINRCYITCQKCPYLYTYMAIYPQETTHYFTNVMDHYPYQNSVHEVKSYLSK